MDRELIVLKEGYVLGQITFKYGSQTSGRAVININQIVDAGHGMKAVYPLYKFETEFAHQELDSIEAVIAFDKDFFKRQPDMEAQLEGDIDFTYPAIHYRYVISAGGVVGIADIDADFLANKKALQFISGVHIQKDRTATSDSLESNVTLLKRLCTLINFSDPGVTFAEVNRK